MYESFLNTVDLFSTMEPYERSKLCDAFKRLTFKAGDLIIKEGDSGNDLCVLQEGSAYATK